MTTPQSGRRYRRAAAFLIHWHAGGGKDLGTEGALEILCEVERDNERDGDSMAGFACALASLFWEGAKSPDPEAAMEYLRRVAAKAAVDEVAS